MCMKKLSLLEQKFNPSYPVGQKRKGNVFTCFCKYIVIFISPLFLMLDLILLKSDVIQMKKPSIYEFNIKIDTIRILPTAEGAKKYPKFSITSKSIIS